MSKFSSGISIVGTTCEEKFAHVEQIILRLMRRTFVSKTIITPPIMFSKVVESIAEDGSIARFITALDGTVVALEVFVEWPGLKSAQVELQVQREDEYFGIQQKIKAGKNSADILQEILRGDQITCYVSDIKMIDGVNALPTRIWLGVTAIPTITNKKGIEILQEELGL